MSSVVKVDVTRQDIDNGEQNECRLCPIAIALHRATGKRWEVDGESARELVLLPGDDVYFRKPRSPWVGLPRTVRQFIKAFDNGEDVQPFNFELVL